MFGLSVPLGLLWLSGQNVYAAKDQLRSRAVSGDGTTDYSLVTRGILPAGWSVYTGNGNDGGGCFVDKSPRVLAGAVSSSWSMSIDTCLSFCQNQGFSFAGLEYSYECYCGNTMDNVQPAPSSECSLGCGSGGGQCGNAWRLNVYQFDSPAAPVLTAETILNGWTSGGCIKDGQSRALTGFYDEDSAMTPAKCTATCKSQGFSIAGMEYGFQCFCGNELDNGLGHSIDASHCDAPCPGDGSQSCGGTWALSIWNAETSPGSNGWNYQGCVQDNVDRVLTYNWNDGGMTVSSCLASCAAKGYVYGGVEYANECWCGAIPYGNVQTIGESSCGMQCGGGGTQCGGEWALSLWKLGGSTAATTQTTTSTTASSTATSALTSTSTTSSSQTTTSASPAATTTSGSSSNNGGSSNSGSTGSYSLTANIPGSNQNKFVWAHHIVGNTYPYTYSSWVSDIQMAQSGGIDGFVLNIGPDSWQPSRVADAYSAAQNLGFKMMISFDMTAFSCGDGSNIGLFQQYLQYLNHPAAAQYQGKSTLTTFSGESCTFGQGSVNGGWAAVLAGQRGSTYWMPNYNIDPTQFGNFDIDADVNWGSAWPVGATDIDTSRDSWFMQNLGSKGYVGTVSPLFFTHLPWKNFVWRGDDWLFSQRWEQLIGMRSSIDQVEMLAWNDYGESIYMDNFGGAMPSQAEAYANNQFPHSDLLSLSAFYAAAWKTGSYPAITNDQIWVMARPHPAMATASADPFGPPTGRELTQDNLYAQVHLTAPASVTLCAGSSCSTQQGQAGINRFSQPLVVGSGISVQVVRNGQTTATVTPNFTFNGSPAQYNFNYLIQSS